jgi:hypothetical protein
LIGGIDNIAAETSGFIQNSVTFAIAQGDTVIKDFSLSADGVGAAGDDSQPYTLLFSAVCAGEADYGSASLGKIVFRMEGSAETYEQDLDVTVSTDTDVTLTREEKDDPTPPPVDPGNDNNDGDSGGGCDAGTAALATLGAAAFALTRRKKI